MPLWAFGVWFRDALALAAPAAILTAALTYFLERGQRPQLAIMQQIALVVSILVPVICWFAIGAGQVHWRNSIQNQKRVRMQLLISPDAIRGAQQMGIVFPSTAGSSGSAELSEPVEIMFQGESSYGLRLNNTQMVRLAKEKV